MFICIHHFLNLAFHMIRFVGKFDRILEHITRSSPKTYSDTLTGAKFRYPTFFVLGLTSFIISSIIRRRNEGLSSTPCQRPYFVSNSSDSMVFIVTQFQVFLYRYAHKAVFTCKGFFFSVVQTLPYICEGDIVSPAKAFCRSTDAN